MTYDHDAVMEAVTEAVLDALLEAPRHELPAKDTNARIHLANLIRRDVARRLAVPTPKESQ